MLIKAKSWMISIAILFPNENLAWTISQELLDRFTDYYVEAWVSRSSVVT